VSWLLAHPAEVGARLAEHVGLSAAALGLALVLAVPTGLAAARWRRLEGPVLGMLGVVYTVPSLALFVALIPVLGLGRRTALVALVAYGQVFLVRNIVAGLRGVDPAVREAARGMGMGSREALLQVELPLALPVILAGVRAATASTIGLATLGALIDAGGLGTLLFEGVAQYNRDKILAGALAASALALAANLGLGALERRAERAAHGA